MNCHLADAVMQHEPVVPQPARRQAAFPQQGNAEASCLNQYWHWPKPLPCTKLKGAQPAGGKEEWDGLL